MKSRMTATVENGQLKLDERLQLPDASRVQVTIESVGDWRSTFKAGLASWIQLCDERPVRSGGRRFTREELHERR